MGFKRRMNRILALLLSMLLCLGMMPVTALAAGVIDVRGSGYTQFVEVIPNFDWPLLYTGEEQDLLDVTVKVNGVTLTEGTDYEVSYDRTYWKNDAKAAVGSNENPVGAADKTLEYPIRVDFKGNYSGYWRPASDGSGTTDGYGAAVQYRIMPRLTENVYGNYSGWNWTLDTDGLLTIQGAGEMPYEMQTSSNANWHYDYKEYVKTLVVTGEVTSICSSAFSDNRNLIDATLPDTVKVLKDNAFEYCNCLRSVHTPGTNRMPSALTTIESRALGMNTYNLEIYLPDNVTSIGLNNARDTNKVYCKHGTATEASMKQNYNVYMVEDAEGFYFYGGSQGGGEDDYKLYRYNGPGGEVTLPSFATEIPGANLFYATRATITKVTVPASIKSFDASAFEGLENLREIEIEPGELTTLPSNFPGDSDNYTITIPDTVTTVKGFSGSNHLLIVGKNSAAYTWAADNGYTAYTSGEITGHQYKLRTVTQPYITPTTADMDTAHVKDVTVTKNDGTSTAVANPFTFVGVKNGTTTLTKETDYTVSGDTVKVKASYLKTLGAGTHTITFDYDGSVDGETAIDPTLTVTIEQMASPLLKVTGNGDEDVTDNCTVVWKNGSTTLDEPIFVPVNTKLSYTVTPGDALKVDGVQYYKSATGSVTLTKEDQPVNVTLDEQGTLTVEPKDGENDVPAAAYTVNWYTKSGETYSKAGTGVTSPMKDAGAKLYYEIVIGNDYKDDYSGIDKTEVAVAFGNTVLDVALNSKNNITLNITGMKKDVDGTAEIAADDYTVTWFTMNEEGIFVSTGKTGAKLLGPEVGTKYYYEIAPKDKGSKELNWLKFNGVPASEDVFVEATEAAQIVDIVLEPVAVVNFTGTVTISGGNIEKNNLNLSLTQTPWSGYQCGPSAYNYSGEWQTVSTELNNSKTLSGNTITFSATVCKFDAMLKAVDVTDNFSSAYQIIRKDDIGNDVKLTLTAEALPESLPVTIERKYPFNGIDNYNNRTLTYGSAEGQGDFGNMTFTLTNNTKGKVVDPEYYTMTPTRIIFNQSDLVGIIDMNDELTLTAEFNAGTQAVWTTSSAAVRATHARIEGFKLAYQEYGRVLFSNDTWKLNDRSTYGIYDTSGNLVEGRSDYYSYGITSGKLAPGSYTLAVWRETNWLNPPATLSGLQEILDADEYQTTDFTVNNGLLTKIRLAGAISNVEERTLFREESGFSQERVVSSMQEWTLTGLHYAVDEDLMATHPEADYEITVTTFPFAFNSDQANVLPRYENSGSTAAKDRFISLYVNDRLADSTVKVNFHKDHPDIVNGFTLYTNEPEGDIYFYIRPTKGGDFTVSADGVMKDGSLKRTGALGEMTISCKGGQTLRFTSDYLRTIDNGGASVNGNGAWVTVVPGAKTILYMDDIAIGETTANGKGTAAFCFTMDWDKTGNAETGEFRTLNPDWSLAGRHELYAEYVVNGITYRTATSVMECVTAQNFTPAELTKVTLECSGRSKVDLMSWDGTTNPSIKDYYWPGDTYIFTATVEDGDAVFCYGDGYGMMLTLAGEDGSTYATMMERSGNTFTCTISEEGLFFTNWSVRLASVAERKKEDSSDFNEFLEKHGNEKICDPVTKEVVTVDQLYNNVRAQIEAEDADVLSEYYAYEYDSYMELLREIATEFYQVPADFDWDSLDNSEESFEKIMEIFGYYKGYANEEGLNYESWTGWSEKAKADDGAYYWEGYTTESGKQYYTAWTVMEPSGDDPGWYIYHRVDISKAMQDPVQNTESGSLLGVPRLTSPNPESAGGRLNGLINTKTLSNMVRRAYTNKTGSAQMGGQRDTLNWDSEYCYKNLKNSYLQNYNGTQAQQERESAQNKKSLQENLKGLLTAGPKTLGERNYENALDAYNTINNLLDKGGFENLDQALSSMLSDMESSMWNSGEYKNMKDKDLFSIENIIKNAYDQAYGLDKDYMRMGMGFDMGRLEQLAKDKNRDLWYLLRALADLQKTLQDMGARGEAFNIFGEDGGGARAIRDPEGIIYEAVLSNPVEGATAVLYEKTAGGEVFWDAGEYGQINPQVTDETGEYQWFVPEGEWQVRVTAPEGSDLSDNTSAGHPAAMLDDGSSAGWLPVMPVQMGIHIPLFSKASPEVTDAALYEDHAKVTFSLYMDISTLTDAVITISDGTDIIPCTIDFPDQEADPLDETKAYAKTVVLTPEAGSFDGGKTYVISVTENAEAYNGKTLEEAYVSDDLKIDAGHVHVPGKPVIKNWIPATCCEPGSYEEIVYCSECGKELSAETYLLSIDPDAHDWGEWTTTKEPTEDEKGLKTRVCRNDPSHIETKDIPATGHGKARYSEEWVNGKWYDRDGSQTYDPTGNWKKAGTYWMYVDTSGWYPKNRWQKIDFKWYFFDREGHMLKDAYQKDASGTIWYLGKNGAWDGKAAATGWVQDTNGWMFYTDDQNTLKNTWKMINGNWYFFKADGYIAMNEFVQGWWLNKTGAWKDPVHYSWHRSGSKWWYGVKGGWYAKGKSYTIDGKKYTFDKNGYTK